MHTRRRTWCMVRGRGREKRGIRSDGGANPGGGIGDWRHEWMPSSGSAHTHTHIHTSRSTAAAAPLFSRLPFPAHFRWLDPSSSTMRVGEPSSTSCSPSWPWSSCPAPTTSGPRNRDTVSPVVDAHIVTTCHPRDTSVTSLLSPVLIRTTLSPRLADESEKDKKACRCDNCGIKRNLMRAKEPGQKTRNRIM